MSSEPSTLDPRDWESFRKLAHRMVDDMLDFLAALDAQPVWQPVPSDSRRALDEPVPYEAQGEERAYADFLAHVLPYSNGNRHPRFFGWAQGNGTPLGMMSDMLAAAMNPHLAGFAQAPAIVEAKVIAWFVELMGFPQEASGVFALGGTMANVLALAAARQAMCGFELRTRGLYDAPSRYLVYGSGETHSWLKKALELLGMGSASWRLSRADLAAQIAEDRALGLAPMCIVGNAGTINTGDFDDLEMLADVAEKERVWFHVDGALGGLAMLSDRLRPRMKGVERADSFAFDLHKWMYQPFDVACVLVRARGALEAAFASSASYIAAMERGVIAGGLPFADRGVDLTRGFRALKVWMAMKAHGVRGIARAIEANVRQAQMLAARIDREPELERVAPVPLNIVCFRFKGSDALNQELLLRIQESGVAVPSSTIIDGRFALRCAFVNHRTKDEDIDRVIDAVLTIGRELA